MLSAFLDYSVLLLECALQPSIALPIRQLAALLLKKYIDSHWSPKSEKFAGVTVDEDVFLCFSNFYRQNNMLDLELSMVYATIAQKYVLL